MIVFVLAYLGGVLTILSPCILPVLPFVFASTGKPFATGALPLLLGMALTFAAVATLAAVGGGWAAEANQYGRFAALALMALFGLTLLWPHLGERLMAPLAGLGARLTEGTRNQTSFAGSMVLGAATGLLWAPCAGPILGLVLTGAALSGANARTSVLLLAYGAGAATSLGLALGLGGRVARLMKRSLGAGVWVRRGVGIAVLAGVVMIASGLDTGLLTNLSLGSTARLEQALVDRLNPAPSSSVIQSEDDAGGSMMMAASAPEAPPPVEGEMPALSGAVQWLNSPPLSKKDLAGKVVLVDFWTYSCINCLRALPYVRAWAEKYKDRGLVVIGVHAPEFAFERDIDNVRRATRDLGITYPVAIDNDYAIWRAFGNRYWPAHYFIDAKGQIRHHHFGEGDYEQSEKILQQLLQEAGKAASLATPVTVSAAGSLAPADMADVQSPETYIGFERARDFAVPGGVVENRAHRYPWTPPTALNSWTLAGDWTVSAENARSNAPGARLSYRFHARDLHLVLGATKPVRFRVLIDGQPPGADHGADSDADGIGVITGHRLYQLIRQNKPVADRDFVIEFLDPGAQAFAFTFG